MEAEMTQQRRTVAPHANISTHLVQAVLSRTLVAANRLCTAMLVACTAAASVLAEEGIHARTTTRLLDAFNELQSTAAATTQTQRAGMLEPHDNSTGGPALKTATFGSGCFWCSEAVFEQLHGVKRVVSGYSGGFLPNPTYQQVLTKTTGHAEVVQVEYDPRIISYAKLLEVFWFTHDPTTINRQGVDKGPQYRSVIFFHDEMQRELAELYKKKLDESKAFRNPIVTEITKFSAFYPAENYHQDYFMLNGKQPYCQQHIRPKVQKFRKVFQDELKRGES
jgi:peptide-methionine (S)-S-oxide reductase